ncbi:MAG: 3-oxoacyl-[acyl-carrier-protein] synthase III C-terminal domain-containing protein [Chitinispirillia bacterium]|jgi:3-oxoacyl-[acyl-carrier-protein] synthase-3
MGAVIESVGLAKPSLFNGGTVKLSAKAATVCLQKVNVDPCSIDVIINSGVYKQKHIGEPALASMIQKNIGANPLWTGRGTFAFDLNNGGCGFLTGIELINGFILSDSSKLGLVVASDIEPMRGLSEGFDYKPLASAVLLRPGREDEGFTHFKSCTYPEYKNDLLGIVKWGHNGRNKHVLVVDKKKKYLNDCVTCVNRSLDDFFMEINIKKEEIDLVIASQSPKNFIDKLKEHGFKDRVVDVTSTYGNIHTAGAGAALDRAIYDGNFKKAKNILFLLIGAGIIVSMGLYKNRQHIL